jgi:hypothetical protein
MLSSGMGEVPGENYLLMKVGPGREVEGRLIPLDPALELASLNTHSVPPQPGVISGPGELVPGSTGIAYQVEELPNVTGYRWELPMGLLGSSDSHHILVEAEEDFRGGILQVRAERDGFGTGPPSSLQLTASDPALSKNHLTIQAPDLSFRHGPQGPVLTASGLQGTVIRLTCFDSMGRLLLHKEIRVGTEKYQAEIHRGTLPEGAFILRAVGKGMASSVLLP